MKAQTGNIQRIQHRIHRYKNPFKINSVGDAIKGKPEVLMNKFSIAWKTLPYLPEMQPD